MNVRKQAGASRAILAATPGRRFSIQMPAYIISMTPSSMPATVSVHRERIPAECSRTIAEETRMLTQKTTPNFLFSTRWMSSIRRELSTTPSR